MHDGAFEFLSVELGHGGFQVCASLKLDETARVSRFSSSDHYSHTYPLPSLRPVSE